MKKLALVGLGVGLLLASASAGLASSNDPRFGHPSRQLANERAEERERESKPYALTGSDEAPSWEMRVGRNPSGRPQALSLRRAPADS